MKIKTQFDITLIGLVVLLIFFFGSIAATQWKIGQLQIQRDQAAKIEEKINQISYLSNEYLIYHENQHLRRWEAKYASILAYLTGLQEKSPDRRALLNPIEANLGRVKEVFDDTVSILEDPSRDGDQAYAALVRTLWSRMGVQNQEMSFAASRLLRSINDDIDRWNQTNLVLIIGLIVTFGFYFIAISYIVYKRTLKSVAKLQVGTKIIGAGNLEYAIEENRNDEIGELCRAFNEMTARLSQSHKSLKNTEAELRHLAEELEGRVEERTAELAESNRELEAFSYTVSHDLRAPLRHITSFVEMLSEDAGPALDEQGRRYIGIIADAARRMGSLIDDLLTFSRIGRETLPETIVDLQRIVSEVRTELEPETADREIDWIIGPLPQVRGEPALLRTVMVNLLSNAIKYTRQRVPARIEVGSWVGDGEVICFVRDNGAGFDMLFADKLFGVFQRLHRAEEFEGTGIGLASVRRIIQRHGGRTWGEGEVDKGATFFFSLPAQRVQASAG